MSQEAVITRKALLRGFWREERKVIRPPWAASSVFTDLCSPCNKCISSCHTNIIVKGAAGFPEIDFKRGACDFCKACLRSCPTQALNQDEEKPWNLSAEINGNCISFCRICEDHCQERAIRMRPELGGKLTPVISAEKCNGCGACVAPCPAHIVTLIDKGEKLAQHT